VTIYTDQLAALSIQTAQLSGASRDPGQVLTPAGSAAATGVPRAALTLVGALVGLLLGLAIAFVRESGDRRLREPWDVESAGLPVLATLKAPQSAPPDAEEVERYRTLRTAVLTHAPAPRVIAVAALSPATLSADVAAGLGTALARGGSEATIVLTSPGSGASGKPRAGLAEVLLEDADASELRDNAGPSLYLLEPGRQIEAAAEMFASEKLRTALRDLAGSSGYVLVAAPVTGTAASTALAVVCDAVVLVNTLEDSTLQDLTAAVDEVERVRGHVLGAVAVQPTRRGNARLRKASSSLPRITRGSVIRWRALFPRRTRAEDTAAERSRAQSTGTTALTPRIARAAGSRDLSATDAPQATEDSSILSSDGAAATADSPGKPAPPSKSRKNTATKQPSVARMPKSHKPGPVGRDRQTEK
jgi:Mrp family chromosome partitioning ATPase